MSIQTPLARARGLGSAKEGVSHWWAQRLTAIALVPLTIWFVFSVACQAGGDTAGMLDWIASPFNAVLLVIYMAAVFYHSQLGLQVVVEDYVHNEGLKLASLVLLQFGNVLLVVAAIFSVLYIALGGGQ